MAPGDQTGKSCQVGRHLLQSYWSIRWTGHAINGNLVRQSCMVASNELANQQAIPQFPFIGIVCWAMYWLAAPK
jgi:hypothetical protein